MATMSLEALTYPFIFIALYFESFLLVTFLSKPARERRIVTSTDTNRLTPKVAIVVPCWNESSTVAGTVESLLALEYPADKLSIILVDDGSTDGTGAVIDSFAKHPQIAALHKENGGKYTAMNLGIEHAADAEFIGFLDADSFVAPDALREVTCAFEDLAMMAITSSMSIHKPQTLMQRMQYAEYSLSITLRHAFASINGLYVTPGPFSFYRRSIFDKIGRFIHAHLAEDMEMAMRMQRAGMQIGNALRARVYTKGPPTLPKLVKQRVRWTTGFLRNILFEYRDLIWNRQNAVLGILILPFGLLAVAGGIFIFVISLTQIATSIFHALSVAQAAPFSYAFTWHPFSWFYIPVTVIMLFGATLALTTLVWMAIGKRTSNTPGHLIPNVIVYLLLYGFIAPIWLIQSVSHVVRGVRTAWR